MSGRRRSKLIIKIEVYPPRLRRPVDPWEDPRSSPPPSSRILNPMPKAAIVLLLFGLAVLLVTLLAVQPPPPLELAVVVVDAGHGGRDPGAIVSGVQEKDINLALALRVQRKAESISSIEVILTRTGDTYPALLERLALAEALGARLYVSIHANYYSDSRICGVETWVDSNAGAESLRLAREVQRAVVASTGAADRGVRRQTLYLRHTKLPTALVEVGYLSCPAERAKLQDPVYQDKVAAGILAGILSFLRGP
ncbi:MAG: N-acetylmuramoyl-L-alanine amidase [Thermofilaceae archaeon]